MMVSVKERRKFDMLFQKQAENMKRQARSLERLASATIILSAALKEIAESDPPLDADAARQRAVAALDEAEAIAAAYRKVEEESTDDGEPTPSEENQGE